MLRVTLEHGKANARDRAAHRIMGDVLADLRYDLGLRVTILTSAGSKFFFPGWDLKAATDGNTVHDDYGVDGFGGLQKVRGLNKPMIAAVTGIGQSGGLELAHLADMTFAADHSSFALPKIRSGTGANAASFKQPKRIPYHIAMVMLLTSRWLAAEEDSSWGMISRIVPAVGLMTQARDLADVLASGPPLVYEAIREVVREEEGMEIEHPLNKIARSQFETVKKNFAARTINGKAPAPLPRNTNPLVGHIAYGTAGGARHASFEIQKIAGQRHPRH